MVNQFHDMTGATERTATRFLKAAGYKLDVAIDQYYSSSASESGASPLQGRLESLFESLRDASNDEKNKMELESTMSYLGEKLGVSLENAELFVVMELVQAPSIGEITRSGFVDGWKSSRVDADVGQQAAHVRSLVANLSTDVELYKKVYRYAFVVGRERDQKALSLENALVYWGMLFSSPGWQWVSRNHDWLEHWKRFLSEKWTRSVNKDMWNMLLEFALKSKEDESLSFWSEDGAWPSVIDDFVDWCKQNVIDKQQQMDVDAQN